jgi:hypothetical protein
MHRFDYVPVKFAGYTLNAEQPLGKLETRNIVCVKLVRQVLSVGVV